MYRLKQMVCMHRLKQVVCMYRLYYDSIIIRNSCSICVSRGSIFQQLLYYQSYVPNIAWIGYRYQPLLVLCVCLFLSVDVNMLLCLLPPLHPLGHGKL